MMSAKIHVHKDLQDVFDNCELIIPEKREDLIDLTFGGTKKDFVEVVSKIPGKEDFVEATVTRCKNGAVVNYTEAYMRRRDPQAMVIGDEGSTDKKRFTDRFKKPFDDLRQETYQWLQSQSRLIMILFNSGGPDQMQYPTMLITPENAGFFALGLADLQGFVPKSKFPKSVTPISTLILAPHFRHTHFDGKQVVVHNRREDMHEVFCYNLYPGPSAKKGVYGILLNIGERESWTTLHSSSVKIVTPYDNEFVILHEGASGGGKSEMTQLIRRETDGKILLGRNIVSENQYFIELQDTCELYPVTDDMSYAHPDLQHPKSRRLAVRDAEAGWFLRVNHLDEYGLEPQIEKLCIRPPEPLVFFNIDAQPNATALLWEHTEDSPGVPCPNPRVIVPRHFIPHIVDGVVSVDVRSFGVRTPPTTRKKPNYGIIGMLHIIPPALAWLWRLAAPRGHSNPSIIGPEGLTSEGVGTFWPFATGKRVTLANILLDQIQATPHTKYVLIPNQYIGAYEVGFTPEWIVREYLARRGSAKFRLHQLAESPCTLLGYTLPSLKINGQQIPKGLLDVSSQIEVGEKGFQVGAKILDEFFKSELAQYKTKELSSLGREIIDICFDNGTLDDYVDTISEY